MEMRNKPNWNWKSFHQREFPKAKVWYAAESFMAGQYIPRLDGKKFWHFADEGHWMEADTFDNLIQAVKDRGWFNAT